jgi:uncharacterized phage protein (TIGR01671 family)
MREIKYRMWNKKEKKMYDIGVLDFDDKKAYMRGYLNYTVSNYMFENIELMQYTGLHDKNGKEIYEGDVLRFSEVDTAIVKWNEKYSYFMVKPIQDYYFDSDVLGHTLEYNDSVEVIGNIYENPDLLKGADNIE